MATETNPLPASSEPEAGDGEEPPESTEWFGDDLTLPDTGATVVQPPDSIGGAVGDGMGDEVVAAHRPG
ncbi:hypothetical protein EDC02_2245 [Micromonospora sp. Llam0]|uniref:hypothetical protein n=1 Tax=Micromonospora sp. Llam0 TaxID=2485143 RepID=UPI000FACC44B|nr:hypothetical protein [Micromonospora sp. Llam0]ROO60382.1 hypothetical protein EDC02_2245 [Micromonospora sp. Llam0]